MSIFKSHQVYLNGDHVGDVPAPSNVTIDTILQGITNNASVKPMLYQLLSILQADPQTAHVDLMDRMFPLLNDEDKEIRGCAYVIIEKTAAQLDADDLVERMMDQLICISWDFETELECVKTARLSSMYMALFGQGLEQMKRAREWMLFLPFLANYVTKTMDGIESVMIEKSLYGGHQRKRDGWEETVDLFVGSCLDLIEFIHTRTVVPSYSEFPVSNHFLSYVECSKKNDI
ncbi:uncharacterized protein EV154DRAFT_523008 [Mucor mucedo]|uniref:uncharacterized protein n=1 Tax=Mucor mucedo TaxID=29922 RepID=UPI002220DB75|nr:uncharacterized protein EV154DRAFT_523008 [Mucor mucedo]KAI7882307.1 hypothetical protein EV154DRAFT_523008 [Mucor mucedo]